MTFTLHTNGDQLGTDSFKIPSNRTGSCYFQHISVIWCRTFILNPLFYAGGCDGARPAGAGGVCTAWSWSLQAAPISLGTTLIIIHIWNSSRENSIILQIFAKWPERLSRLSLFVVSGWHVEFFIFYFFYVDRLPETLLWYGVERFYTNIIYSLHSPYSISIDMEIFISYDRNSRYPVRQKPNGHECWSPCHPHVAICYPHSRTPGSVLLFFYVYIRLENIQRVYIVQHTLQ